MSGETEQQPSGFTVDSLKVLEDEKIRALEQLFGSEIRRLEAIIKASGEAVELLSEASHIAQDKFEATVRDGFVKQNEFRGSLDDLGKTMATRRETEVAYSGINGRIDDLSKQIGDLRSRVDVGPAGLARLASSQSESEGRTQAVGRLSNVAYMMAVVIIAVISVIVVYATRSHTSSPAVTCSAIYHPAPCP